MKNTDQKAWRQLPFGKRVWYLCKTYVWHTVLAVILLYTVGLAIWKDLIREQPLLRVEMIDAPKQSAEGEAFGEFLSRQGHSGQTGRIELSKRIQLTNRTGKIQCDPGKLFKCTVFSDRTDIYFWDSMFAQPYLMEKTLLDLREILPEQVLREHEDQLIYTGLKMQGGYPCGVKLEHNSWVQEHGYYEHCAVGIADCVEEPELAGEFLIYLLEQEQPDVEQQEAVPMCVARSMDP